MNMGLPSCQRPSKNVQADLVAVPRAAIGFLQTIGARNGRRTINYNVEMSGIGVENVAADFYQTLERGRPFRIDIVGVVISRRTQNINGLITGERARRDLLGMVPIDARLGLIADAVAGKGKLAGIGAAGALIDNTANSLRVIRILDAIEDDLGHGELTHFGFGAGLEINCAGKAIGFGQPELALGD